MRYLILLAVMTSAVATLPAQDARFFETDDGTPFLLVPINHHVVNWVNLQPAPADEEPPGMQGLGLAIAHASLAGGATKTVTPESPAQWEKALRRAPASGSRVVQVPGYVGVSVTFPLESLERVAKLLRVRTHRSRLLGVAELFADIRRRRLATLAATPQIGMMRRMLARFESTKKLEFVLNPSSDATVTDKAIEEFYRRTYVPARSLNVLTGRLPIAATEKILRAVFSAPARWPAPLDTQPDRIEPANSKVKVKVKDPQYTLLLGCPLPAKMDMETMVAMDLLVEYLAGDDDGFLPDHLRASGHPRVSARAVAPFPETGGIFLIAITDPGTEAVEDSQLVVHLEQALAKIATEAPDPKRLARAAAALRAQRSSALRQPEGLALLLSRRWARAGEVPTAGLAEANDVSVSRFKTLAQRIFALSGQTLILPEKPR